jgi:hypothetical protein
MEKRSFGVVLVRAICQETPLVFGPTGGTTTTASRVQCKAQNIQKYEMKL